MQVVMLYFAYPKTFTVHWFTPNVKSFQQHKPMTLALPRKVEKVNQNYKSQLNRRSQTSQKFYTMIHLYHAAIWQILNKHIVYALSLELYIC